MGDVKLSAAQKFIGGIRFVRRTLEVLNGKPCWARGAWHLWLDLPIDQRRYWWRIAKWFGLVAVRDHLNGEPLIALTPAGRALLSHRETKP